ncbi:MAG: YraN family protein [Bacteroidales bacterium]|nr:YraN family protein [Bacteroidales bacterium]
MEIKGNKALGRLGEEMACDFLQSRGHRILERNWQGGHLEVDIISEGPDGVHFVEVKSRMASSEEAPEQKVDARKQRRISDAAVRYLRAQGSEQEVFFDVVSVLFEGSSTIVRYFPQAWIPIYA